MLRFIFISFLVIGIWLASVHGDNFVRRGNSVKDSKLLIRSYLSDKSTLTEPSNRGQSVINSGNVKDDENAFLKRQLINIDLSSKGANGGAGNAQGQFGRSSSGSVSGGQGGNGGISIGG